jgi:ATP-dependent protease HslVU (ClpYQ) peptidase subunit
LPQLTQVASNIYQEISKLSKVAKIENTFEPQGQACIGPSERRSVPNFGGRLSLFFNSLGRRNILGLPSAAHRAPLTLLIRLTAHSITIHSSGKFLALRRVVSIFCYYLFKRNGANLTAIVGIQGKGWAVIASDSMTTYTDKPYIAKGYDKIVKVNEYLIAVAGDASAGDILNNLWQPPKVIKSQDPDRFLMIRVLPSIKQTLTDAGYDPSPKGKNDDDAGWDALICFNGKLFQVSDDYGYMRDDRGLYGIGSGGGLALGALVALGTETKTHAKAASAAKKAINIAIQYNVWCGGVANIRTQFTKQGRSND